MLEEELEENRPLDLTEEIELNKRCRVRHYVPEWQSDIIGDLIHLLEDTNV